MALVMVDCISTFHMRYVVETPDAHPEYALDTVTMNEAKEFSQKHIGEQIVTHRVVSKKELIKICDEDNNYCSDWPEEKKIEVFVTLEKDLKK